MLGERIREAFDSHFAIRFRKIAVQWELNHASSVRRMNLNSPSRHRYFSRSSHYFFYLDLIKKIFVGTCWWNFRYYYLYILRPSHCTWKLYCSFFNLFFIHFNSVFKSIGMNNVSRNHIGRTLMVYSTRVPTQNPLCKHSVWVFLYMSVISDSNSNRFLPWTQFFVLSWIKNESNKYHNA